MRCIPQGGKWSTQCGELVLDLRKQRLTNSSKLVSGVNGEMNLKRKAPAFTGAECWRALSKITFLRPEATAN
jgi:hypothetical protein